MSRQGRPSSPMQDSNRNDDDARFRVALIVETSNEYARGLLRGIVHYSSENGPWSFSISEHGPWLCDFHGEGKDTVLPDWLERWEGDGIIARIESPSLARLIENKGLPTVDVGAFHEIEALPWVVTDDVAAARLAFEHLTERGFRHLAFATDGLSRGLAARAEEFGRLAAEASCTFELLEFGEGTSLQLEDRIRDLPKPLGIMAGYDVVGRRVLGACSSVGISVPEEVGVIGVDDDELVCSLTDPPLSSVILNTHRTGYEAARVLEECMRGECRPRTVLIPPLGVLRPAIERLPRDRGRGRGAGRAVHSQARVQRHLDRGRPARGSHLETSPREAIPAPRGTHPSSADPLRANQPHPLTPAEHRSPAGTDRRPDGIPPLRVPHGGLQA